MATTAFDPVAYKRTTTQQWQEAAPAWHRWGPTLEEWLGEATELMLDLARIGEGSHVLDVAAGAGGQTLAAARRVGPGGSVLATDISTNILEFAAREARAAGVGNVATRVMDGESLEVKDESVEAVISRVGLIYFPDQQRALGEMRRALRPGGRVSAIVYSTPERNQFFSIPVSIIRRRAGLPAPAPGLPGPFSLGQPGVLEAAYEEAGFREAEVRAVDAPVRFSSAAECVRFERESFGALHAMLAGVPEDERQQAWTEIEDELRQFEGPEGFVGPCELLVERQRSRNSPRTRGRWEEPARRHRPVVQMEGSATATSAPASARARIAYGPAEEPLARACFLRRHAEFDATRLDRLRATEYGRLDARGPGLPRLHGWRSVRGVAALRPSRPAPQLRARQPALHQPDFGGGNRVSRACSHGGAALLQCVGRVQRHLHPERDRRPQARR